MADSPDIPVGCRVDGVQQSNFVSGYCQPSGTCLHRVDDLLCLVVECMACNVQIDVELHLIVLVDFHDTHDVAAILTGGGNPYIVVNKLFFVHTGCVVAIA